ncbi:helix-turn-helix domain-containing protein [Nocardia acidivorans]|uniref:helix-turn-helix domain-containing protein n=1 Tax=Nocardia acidivorans TaxID=404580 RepID=UPI000AE0D967
MRAYSNQGTLTSTLERLREQASEQRKLETVRNPPQTRALARRLTETQRAAIVTAYEAGSSANRLATEYGLGKGSVLKILRTSGAAIRQQRRLTDQEIDHALACYRDGQSLARIASRLDVAHTTVMTALERRGVPRRDSHGRPR